MFKRVSVLLLLAAMAFWVPTASAQQGSLVTIAPTPSVSVIPYVTGTPSDSGTINKQLTVTITPPAGQYVYVVGWDMSACQNATSTAMTNLTFTTTGFTNLPKIGQVSLAATVNICSPNLPSLSFGSYPLKSATPGAAVTFVSPAATANAAFTLNVYAYTAP